MTQIETMFTVEQVAKQTHSAIATVRRWIREGDLIASKIGRKYLVSESDLARFIEERKNTTAEGK